MDGKVVVEMDKACQVKQYVSVVQGPFCKMMVFETGDPKFYLFSALDEYGCQTGLQFPVKKSDLKKEIRSMLRQGCGNAGL